MERRNFLVSIAGVTVLTISGAIYYSSRPIKYDALIVEPQLLSHIWDTNTITSIGNSYVSQTPKENSENELAEALIENISGSPKEMANSLTEKVANDFENGDIVMIDGWMLSRTEARQCGLLSKKQIKS
jgi:hypothetical protein